MENRELIDAILDIELQMFLTVPSLEPASCQQNPARFKVMRGAQFAAWSNATLESYLEDLKDAAAAGRNLMQLKYARMDSLIPPLTDSPLVEETLRVQVRWQRELEARYPFFLKRGRAVEDTETEGAHTSFARYLRGELETYSERTLALLRKDVSGYEARGLNMSGEIYTAMVTALGYTSLEDAEANAKALAGE
jgi:hypothetical protein